MKRRKFTQAIMAVVGFSSLPMCISIAAKTPLPDLQVCKSVTTSDGLVLSINQHVNPTNNRDNKQFILTYDVENNKSPLVEKIYHVKAAGGKSYQVYMTPVADNQLQAVFNWRLNA